jgi:uncharacterized protein YbaR (Trm112 family)
MMGVTDDRTAADRKGSASDAGPAATVPILASWVVGLLACPLDRSTVRPNGSELVCDQCGRRYPVQSGIPRMIPDDAVREQKF